MIFTIDNWKFGVSFQHDFTKSRIFVRKTKRGFEMTDGKGTFWETIRDNNKLTKIGDAIKLSERLTP